MAALLTAATTNTTGTGASHTGPATVFVRGTFDGARVSIQVADENVAASYVKPSAEIMPSSHLSGPCAVAINAQGTYFIRCSLVGAGSSTSITAVSTQ